RSSVLLALPTDGASSRDLCHSSSASQLLSSSSTTLKVYGATWSEAAGRRDDLAGAPGRAALRPAPAAPGVGDEPAPGGGQRPAAPRPRRHASGDALGSETHHRCHGGLGESSRRLARPYLASGGRRIRTGGPGRPSRTRQ